MRGAALAAVFALAGGAHAQAMPETPEAFSAALQGCWNRTTWSAAIEAERADPGYSISSQMCLTGGVEGSLTMLDCGGANNLVECAQIEGRYAFRDEKFWRDFGPDAVAGPDKCDVRLERGKAVTLFNCAWVDAESSATPIEDVTYERAINP